MFDDDDELVEFEKTPFEEWIDFYWIYIPLDLRDEPSDNIELMHFYSHVFINVKRELTPLLLQLAEKQFPIIKTNTRPFILEKINEYISDTIDLFLLHTFNLLHDQKLGVDLRQKYPKLEEWIPFYARLQQPRLYDMSYFEKFPSRKKIEDKKSKLEELNREAIELFNWAETRKRDFIDTVQTVVIKYYKNIFELDSDGWIIYAVNIGDEYGNYKDKFEYIFDFILYEFPEEYINLNYSEYLEKFKEAYENRPDLRHRHVDE